MNKSTNSQTIAADTYKIDSIHSSIFFRVKHLMISFTIGHFKQFDGEIHFDPHNPAEFTASVVIQTASLDTRSQQRDEHLRGPEFFDTAQYPTMSFQSNGISGQEGRYEIAGELTIKGITKDVAFPVAIKGPVKNPMGAFVVGISGSIAINRKDFNLSYNQKLENGSPVADDNVEIEINIEAKK